MDTFSLSNSIFALPLSTGVATQDEMLAAIGRAIPLSVSQLTNDVGFVRSSQVDELVSGKLSSFQPALSVEYSNVVHLSSGGWRRGASLGFVSNNTPLAPDHSSSGDEAYAIPVADLTAFWSMSYVQGAVGASEDSDFVSRSSSVVGYGNYSNSARPLSSVEGRWPQSAINAIPVYARYASQYVEWIDIEGTARDGTPYIDLETKLVQLNDGSYVYRTPRVYYYGIDEASYALFAIMMDEAAEEIVATAPLSSIVVERKDLSGYVPMSDYLALSARVAALEARLTS